MKTLETILSQLKSEPQCLIPSYGNALIKKLEHYIDSNDDEIIITDTPIDYSTNDIKVIELNGVITKRTGLPADILSFFGFCDLDNIDTQLNATLNDDTIQSVILYVTSPGGMLTGVRNTAELVKRLSEKKSVVVYSDVLNASAAYWISSQAPIVSSIDCELGSVGVYLLATSYAKQLESNGITPTLIKAGKWKAIADETQVLTKEDESFLQNGVNEIYDLFKQYVLANRNIKDDDMQGQTFSGEQAIKLGFTDGIVNSIQDLIETIKAEKPIENTK